MSIRVGVLGAGRIGRIHCQNLSVNPDAKLVAIYDPKLDQRWASGLHVEHSLVNEDDFYKLDLDAVVIATPTAEHHRSIMKALERGLHVFCEKPLDLTLESHFLVKEKLLQGRSIFQIGFNRRYDDDFQELASICRGEGVGRPYLIRITSRDPQLASFSYLSSSGGMFLDMTIHDFDMARYIMNSDVVEVFAMGQTLIDKSLCELDDIDTAVVTLTFRNGAFGVIDNSRQAIYGYDQRVELFGSRGSYSNSHHRRESIEWSDSSGCHQRRMLNFFMERYLKSYQNEMSAFIKSCLNNSPASCGIDEAIFATKLALAAHESRLANRPVRVCQ